MIKASCCAVVFCGYQIGDRLGRYCSVVQLYYMDIRQLIWWVDTIVIKTSFPAVVLCGLDFGSSDCKLCH